MTRPETVHALDVVSLVAGLLAVACAALYLLGDLTTLDIGPSVVASAVVAVLGVSGLVVGVRQVRRT